MPPSILGRRITAPTGEREVVEANADNQHAISFEALGTFNEPGWLTGFGLHGGKADAANAELTYALWNRASDNSPQTLRGSSDPVVVSAAMADGGGGTNVEAIVNYANPLYSPSNKAIVTFPGDDYLAGFTLNPTKGRFAHAILPASLGHLRRYLRTVLGGTPTNPFNPAANLLKRWWPFYVLWTRNTPPNVPASIQPNGTITTTEPAFSGAFTDVDVTPFGDRLRAYRFEVRAAGTTRLLWSNQFDANPTEYGAGAYSRVYNGQTLTPGTDYEQRVAVQDWAFEWSEWSPWIGFAVTTAGVVTLNANPTGKLASGASVAYQGRWFHPTGLATNAVQVRLLQSGKVVKVGAIVAKTVTSSASPGSLFTIGAAESGIGDLTPGVEYQYQIRGRATNGIFGTYSDARDFSVNAVPDVPSALQPPAAQTATQRPLLEFVSDDVDDDILTLVGQIRIKDANSALIATVTPTYNPTTERFEFQTTATQLAGTGSYRWDARVSDAIGWSGYSREVSFEWATGPTITITSPTAGQTLTTSQPTITWTVAGASAQASFRVQIYKQETRTLVYDSQIVTGTTNSHKVPAGYLYSGELYDAVLTVTTASASVGVSLRRDFMVQYVGPAPVSGLRVSDDHAPLDTEPTAMLITWDQTDYSPSVFNSYVVRRAEVRDPASSVILRRITNPGQNRWRDYFPASETPYRYSVLQTIKDTDGNIAASEQANAYGSVRLPHVVIASVVDGGTRRASLRWDTARGSDFKDDQTSYLAWGNRAPFLIDGEVDYEVVDGDFVIVETATSSAREQFETLLAIKRSRDTICWRDERGKRLFGKITSFRESDRRLRRYGLRLQVTETGYREGER